MVKVFPENSLATFENTLKHTPAFYETDSRLTKDSVIVLMHDEPWTGQQPDTENWRIIPGLNCKHYD